MVEKLGGPGFAKNLRLLVCVGISFVLVAAFLIPAMVAANHLVANPDPSVIGADIGTGIVASVYLFGAMFGGGFVAALSVADWRASLAAVTFWAICEPLALLLLTDHYDSGVYVMVLPLLLIGALSVGLGTGLRALILVTQRRLRHSNA